MSIIMQSTPLFFALVLCTFALSYYERIFFRFFKKNRLLLTRPQTPAAAEKCMNFSITNPLLAAAAPSTGNSGSCTPPQASLTLSSTEMFNLERRSLPSKTWHCITHSTRLPAPGSYLTFTLFTLPLFLIRGKDSHLRAFHNVCRHRAYTVTRKSAGKSSVLGCKYHGWSYDTQGKLIKAPHFENVVGFEKGENGLWEVGVRVDERGFVWVRGVGGREEDWEGEIEVPDVEVGKAWEKVLAEKADGQGGVRWVDGWDTGSEEWTTKLKDSGEKTVFDAFEWKTVASRPLPLPQQTPLTSLTSLTALAKSLLYSSSPLQSVSLSPFFHVHPLSSDTFLTLAIAPLGITRTGLRVDIYTTAPARSSSLDATTTALSKRIETQLKSYAKSLSRPNYKSVRSGTSTPSSTSGTSTPVTSSSRSGTSTPANVLSSSLILPSDNERAVPLDATHPFFDLLNGHRLQEEREGCLIALHEKPRGHTGTVCERAEAICKSLDPQTGLPSCTKAANGKKIDW